MEKPVPKIYDVGTLINYNFSEPKSHAEQWGPVLIFGLLSKILRGLALNMNYHYGKYKHSLDDNVLYCCPLTFIYLSTKP